MQPPERRIVRLTIPARAEYITLCRLALTGLARLRPISEELVADLKLALTEATSNSVRHAYGERRRHGRDRVRAARRPARDRGERRRRRASTTTTDGDLGDLENLTEGGLGIAIIRSIADEFVLDARSRRPRVAASLRQGPHRLTQRLLQLVNVGHKSLARLRLARDARPDGRDRARSPRRSPESACCTSLRPPSAAASRRSTTRSSR